MEILDIGVIMSSTTLWMFEDMVERYPGARYFYEDFKGRCICGDPHCAREAMQSNLKHLFEGDKEKCALLFERLSHCDSQPSDTQIRAILVEMGIIVSTGAEEDEFDRRVREQLEELFPGSKVRRIL